MHLNHKAIITSLITILTIGIISACNGNTNTKATSDTDTKNSEEQILKAAASNPQDINPKNIEKQILKLVNYDQSYNPREVMTPELKTLYEEAYALPNEAFGELGNLEQIAYSLNPYQDYDTTIVVCDAITMKGEEKAVADIILTILGHEKRHQFTYKRCDGEWLIDDYITAQNESYRALLTVFIASQRRYFRSNEWTESIKKKLEEENQEEIVKETLKEVEEYFKRYPAPNDVALEENIILDLFHAIPGYWEKGFAWHCDTALMKERFSASTYQLLEQLFDTPELERDGWPDSFWTKYWILSLPEGCYGNSDDSLWIQGCHAEYRNDSLLATIETVYHYWESQVDEPKGFYYYEPMRLYLVKEDGKWVIEDFYCRPQCTRETYKSVQEALPWMKNCIQAYITEIRKELRSDKWKKENNPDKETDPERLKNLQNYLQHVEDYFQKYPDE
ncbi:MAG: hypothetical protein IJS20_08435 [Bacteroidales bacterium]|nr:hypothetical protein [Bacteroidales bacterium]